MAINPGGGAIGWDFSRAAPAPGGETSGAGPVGEDVNAYGVGAFLSPVSSPGSPSTSPQGPGSPVGPQYQPSLNSTAPAPSIFDAYSGPQTDAAKTIIRTYTGLLGYPQGIDTEQMALSILQSGLENQPQSAYEALWSSKFLNDDIRKASPWARFGQDADTFHMNLVAAKDTIKTLTGMDVNLGDMLGGPIDPMSSFLQAAIKGNLSQAQLMQALQAGSITDPAGIKADLTGVTAAEPWLLAGQTYQQQAQQFHSIYGAAPVDTGQLAGWYRFNQSAAQMGPWYARQAVVGAPGKGTLGATQTEVR